MEDQKSSLSRNSDIASVVPGKRAPTRTLVASRPKAFPGGAYKHIASLRHGEIGSGVVGRAAFFLLKVAALEGFRRLSKAKCPFAWRGLQALQLLCYPPLKWIQHWAPFRGLIKTMQALSRPLLVLSIATAFSDHEESSSENSESNSDSQSYSDVSLDPVSVQSASDTRCILCNEAPRVASENWLICLHKELQNQGISLPDRINDDELRRFYVAANGDFSCLLSSVKKTVRWRDTYRILTEDELKMWSDMLFWHGFDVKNRPCLIVRLGRACFSVPSHERPRFAQAVISQVEHGVLSLVDAENGQITVLVDCEGLPPYRIPMQMLRSCFSLLQDHYPNRLGCLFVIRLPPVVRVIAQTLIQVLRPTTREKLRIEGEMYLKVLSECLQMLPAYLGGKCGCEKCRNPGNHSMHPFSDGPSWSNSMPDGSEREGSEDLAPNYLMKESDMDSEDTFNQVVRTFMIAVLMLWLLVALIAGLYDPESRPFAAP
ncbi:uncharacterized protein LOC116200090 isoform X1 [Punica granatum]|uniref:Uncharacterized protein LOC116200090 isoform X1 n=1 Tax=Punica granatum TaxID=22663 RepID=A0A6P8D5C6_PUNGR|nr:uncharacterized protein LOC116200090 isoform X1 [Punica granatum]XP_031386639.1 uncharacterized protein LOC116200090 isoform X1 [Punica granatum]XP_031386640.1 uncharacterized protein LOC116200090 isoform X1 [Punica granatum]XP_031386641.1 uncharacterized protein LOC116200090 isoform X1 [Punica granatum]